MTEPDNWGFVYDFDLVIRGYLKWRRNGFKYMPDPEDVADTDPAWEGDLHLLDKLLEFQLDGLDTEDT